MGYALSQKSMEVNMMLIIMSLIIIGITIGMIVNDHLSDNSFKTERTTTTMFTRERHNMNVIVAEKPVFAMQIQRHK